MKLLDSRRSSLNATAGENTVGDLNLTLTQFKTNDERAKEVVHFLNEVRDFSEAQVDMVMEAK